MYEYESPRRDRKGAPWSVLGGMLLVAALIGVALWGLGVFHFGRQPPDAHDPNAKPREVTPRGPITAEEAERVAVYRGCKPSVVNVDTLVYAQRGFNAAQEERQGTGSGFIWDEAGRIITNFHVIRDALAVSNGQVVVAPGRRIMITMASGESTEARLVGIAPDNDLAVIQLKQLPSDGVKKISVGSSSDLEVGFTVYAIGSPYGQSFTLTHGIISALDRSIQSPTDHLIKGVIQVDAPINPGNSGGPLLDREGHLIGVNTAITSPSGGSVGLGYAIPVDTVNEVVTSLIKTGREAQPYIGAVFNLDEGKLRSANIPKGVLVRGVRPGSPAADAGLRGGELILKVNGQEIEGLVDFERILNKVKVGDTLVFTVRRAGREMDVAVKVEGI
jgi:S1-C subfamily serine protease